MKEIKTIIGQIGIMSLIGLVTLLTLVSCGGGGSADDDLTAPPVVAANEEDMVPITFSGSEGNEATVTRASGTPLSDKDITRFHVWGYKNTAVDYSTYQTVFPGYQVDWQANSAATTTTNTNNWDYIGTVANQYIKYWDWSAKAYRFFAVTGWSGVAAPATLAEYDAVKSYGSKESNSVSMLANASNATEMAKTPYFSRLWFSTGDLVAYADKQFGKPVTLEFVKPYARVRFIYNYVYPREGIKILSQSFKPSDDSKKIYRKGAITVTYPLEGTDTKESFSMVYAANDDAAHLTDFTEDYDPEDDTKVYTTCDNGWYTVLPNNTQGSYTLSVRMKGINNGDPKTAVVPAEYMQWKPGYSYTYIFKITDVGGIEIGWVEYVVTKWTELEADHTVYNW